MAGAHSERERHGATPFVMDHGHRADANAHGGSGGASFLCLNGCMGTGCVRKQAAKQYDVVGRRVSIRTVANHALRMCRAAPAAAPSYPSP